MCFVVVPWLSQKRESLLLEWEAVLCWICPIVSGLSNPQSGSPLLELEMSCTCFASRSYPQGKLLRGWSSVSWTDDGGACVSDLCRVGKPQLDVLRIACERHLFVRSLDALSAASVLQPQSEHWRETASKTQLLSSVTLSAVAAAIRELQLQNFVAAKCEFAAATMCVCKCSREFCSDNFTFADAKNGRHFCGDKINFAATKLLSLFVVQSNCTTSCTHDLVVRGWSTVKRIAI